MSGALNYNTLLEIAKINGIEDENLLELVELVNDIEYKMMEKRSEEDKTKKS